MTHAKKIIAYLECHRRYHQSGIGQSNNFEELTMDLCRGAWGYVYKLTINHSAILNKAPYYVEHIF